jgi:single-strand DNA-binding protein
MSNGLNRCTLVGNITADGALRFTQGGTAVLNFRIACTESFISQNEKKERTEYLDVTVWGKRGEALSKILTKGKQVLVEGSIQTRSWEDKDGSKRYATSINANNIVLLGGGGQRREQRDENSSGPDTSVLDDSIPF